MKIFFIALPIIVFTLYSFGFTNEKKDIEVSLFIIILILFAIYFTI